MKRNGCRAVLPPGGFASFHFYTTHYNGSMTPAISTSGRGRPRAFDRNEALKAALRVFWPHRYAPASVAELCKAMGNNAPSLYAAFGSKAGLFLEALHFYEDSYWDEPAQRLLARPNLFRALVNFFTEAAHILLGPDSPCGCMVVLAAINVGDDATPVMDEVHKLRLATCNLFAERLRRAVQDGQLAAECDIDAIVGKPELEAARELGAAIA